MRLRNDFLLGRRIKQKRRSAQSVLLIDDQIIQRNNGIISGQIGCNVIGVGNAYVGRSLCCDICDNIVVNFTVVGIESEFDLDVWIKRLKTGNGIFINLGLCFICVVFGPEGNFIRALGIELLRNIKDGLFFRGNRSKG